ncbi:MAG: hypothetical protein D8M61_21085 [Ignavibacteriae bacterium]|nr:hypothetical protein [Ignavibacteriota bacterium]
MSPRETARELSFTGRFGIREPEGNSGKRGRRGEEFYTVAGNPLAQGFLVSILGIVWKTCALRSPSVDAGEDSYR